MRAFLAALVAMTKKDIARDVVAVFHDESQINRYVRARCVCVCVPRRAYSTCAYVSMRACMHACARARAHTHTHTDAHTIRPSPPHTHRYWASKPPARTLASSFLYPEPTPEPCWGSAPAADAGQDGACVRDEGHPWLWSPWRPSTMGIDGATWTKELWRSHRRFAIKCLNLSKDRYVANLEADKHRQP